MSPPPPNYRSDIDGLRAVSIIMVLLYHGFDHLLPGGYVGVDVFFVISGYLITKQIYTNIKIGEFSIIDFFARRVRRIFPPLIFVLLCVGAYGYARLGLGDFTSLYKHIAGGATFSSNFLLWKESGYFDKQAELKPLLHLWSLAIEEQFYIVWPAIILSIIHFSRKSTRIFTGLIFLICATSLASSVYLVDRNTVAAFYSPISRFWELGIGGLLAISQSIDSKTNLTHEKAWEILKHTASTAGLILLIVCGLLLSKTSKFPGILAVVPTLSAVLIICAGPSAIANRFFLASKPMVELGVVSYALYLWHWPLLAIFRIESGHENPLAKSLILLGSVALAFVTRSLVENKVRYSTNKHTSIWLICAFILIAVAGALGHQNTLMPKRLLPQLEINIANKFDTKGIPSSNCSAFLNENLISSRFCKVWGNNNASTSIVVWGDSMSTSWMPPFISLQKSDNIRIIQFSHPACPPLMGVRRTGESFAKEWCNDTMLQSQIYEAIFKIKPQRVFLIARWNLYYHGHIKNDVLVESSYITNQPGNADRQSAREAFEKQLPQTVGQLAAFTSVVIFKDTPVLKVPIDVGMTIRPENFEPRASEHFNFETDINKVIDLAASRYDKVSFYAPSSRLCDEIKCPAFLDRVPAYSDEAHITAAAALKFLPEISNLVLKQ